jgi:3',5'-cyclic AMP phosphodiesterase CpdA
VGGLDALLTRREALAGAAAGAFALALGGCSSSAHPAADGSTLQSTWADPSGTGELHLAGGAGLLDRTDLAPRAPLTSVLATLAHVTDAHVLDAESPARVTFLRRLGAPFNSTFRPQETLTAQVLDGAVRAIADLAPDAVIQGGDLIDNAQANELARALAVLGGGSVQPNSGAPGYFGVQWAGDPDPFYYRPDVDAPTHPGMLAAATTDFHAHGLQLPCYPVLGDHDLLVQGVVAPTPLTDAIARGGRAVWELPAGLQAPAATARLAAAAPDGLPAAAQLQPLIDQLLSAPSVRVPGDARRRELQAGAVVAGLREAANLPGGGPLLDYAVDVGGHLRLIVLDLVRREGGSGGLLHAGQSQWLDEQLNAAGRRWVLVVSHQPLASSAGGGEVLALLDRQPRVLAAVCGHTHRNRIVARAGSAGGYWLITTASLIDYPQQARALRVCATTAGAAIQTWMIDHVPGGVSGLGDISRELAYLDAQGGRPQGFAGGPLDRNVTLYRRATSDA